jgi:hypothetical protein
VKYHNNLGRKRTHDARCTSEIKFWFVMAKAAFNRKKCPFTGTLE